jgi:hypothetical protein
MRSRLTDGSLIVARDLSRQEIFGLEWQTP